MTVGEGTSCTEVWCIMTVGEGTSCTEVWCMMTVGDGTSCTEVWCMMTVKLSVDGWIEDQYLVCNGMSNKSRADR